MSKVKNTKKTKTYHFKIVGIDILEKRLDKYLFKEGDLFHFSLKTQIAVNEGAEVLITFVQVGISVNEKTAPPVANFLLAVGFNFINFKTDFNKNNEGKYDVPPDVDNLLKTVSISTIRGIIYSELRGTPLHTAILPVVMADKLVPLDEPIFDLPITENR